MNSFRERAVKLGSVAEQWFRPDNTLLKQAIRQTIEAGYFAEHDVRQAIKNLKNATTKSALVNWIESVDRFTEKEGGEKYRNVLCLHAGNLPMVGFQDVVATILAGHKYVGKISKKDPYLLPAFLSFARDRGFTKIENWSTKLKALMDEPADAILFSGSDQTVPAVRKKIEALHLSDINTRYLIRTAHFSLAYISDQTPKTMQDLTKAIFRYDGRGCRSVAVVVAPFALDDIKCHLTDYIESFWFKNPPFRKPAPALFYRYAYNKAIGRSQAWLDHFLIEEKEDNPDTGQPFLVTWIKGGEETVKSLLISSRQKLQNIYIMKPGDTIKGVEERIDWLWKAQKPSINWKPDGVDPLEWLTTNL